jgi:hypothetical protein
MQNDQTEVRRYLAAAAARASTPQFTAEDVAVRVRRIRRRQARTGTAVSVVAAAVTAAAVIPLTLGGTPDQVSAPAAAGHNPASTSTGTQPPGGVIPPGSIAGSVQPPLPWTVAVNGQARGVPESLADGPTGGPQFDVAPGETVTIAMTVTVPAHTEMTKFFLGITGDTAGIGPGGPIGMKPVLATAAHLAPGAHKFTVRWTVPRGAAPSLGYRLATAALWPKGTKNESVAEEGPLVDFGVKLGIPVPPAAATRIRTQALRAAENDGDAKPAWIVAVRTTFGKAMAVIDPGDNMPTLNPNTPVYVYVMKGDFEIGAGPASSSPVTGHYASAIIDAKTFSAYEGGLCGQGPTVPLASLGPLASLAGGQPARG